jgi:hypothetical protein
MSRRFLHAPRSPRHGPRRRAIHDFLACIKEDVDGLAKPGHDDSSRFLDVQSVASLHRKAPTTNFFRTILVETVAFC